MSEQVGEAHIDVHADATGLTGEVERAAERASRNAQIELDAELARGAISHLQREAAAAARRANATVQFDADTDFNGVIREARLVARAARQRVEFEAHLNTRGIVFDRGLGEFRRAADGSAVSARELDQALEGLGRTAGRTGGRFGGMSQIISNSVVAFGARAVTQIAGFGILIGSIIPYVVALAASLVSLVGAAVQAAGSIVSLGVVFGALAGGFLVAKVGTMGLSDAFKAQQKALDELNRTGKVSKATQEELDAAMKHLAPSARNFVHEVEEMRPAFDRLRLAVQQRLFLDLGDMFEATAKEVIPLLTAGMTKVAGVINDAALSFLTFARSAEGARVITGIFDTIAAVLPPVLTALGQFALGFANLFIGAGPAGKRFAEMLARLGEDFANWTEKISADGSLDRFLTRAQDALEAIGRLAKSAGKFVLALLDGGGLSDNGVQLIERMSTALDKLATWLNDPANQPTIQAFWAQVNENLDRLIGLVEGTDWGQVMHDLQGLADALYILALGLQFLANIGAFGNVFSVIDDLRNTDWGAIWAGIENVDPPDWLTILTGILAPIPVMIGIILGGQGPAIAEAFNAIFAVPPPDWLVILTGILAPIPLLIGIILGGQGPAVALAFQNFFATLQPPDWLGILTGILAPIPFTIGLILGGQGPAILTAFQNAFSFLTLDWLTIVGGLLAPFPTAVIAFLTGQSGSWSTALTGFFSTGPGVVATTIISIISPFFGLASKIISNSGNWTGTLTGWFSGSSGIATATALNILFPFAGLALRIISNAGSIYNAVAGWFSGLGGLAQAAADAILAPFRGLGAAIGAVMGSISAPTVAAAGMIAGAAAGVQVTRGPQLRWIGEAGPEAIVPLTRTQILDPAVNGFLKSVAADRWGTPKAKDGGTIAPQINLMVPTEDPEAAAMAVWNRLVFEGVV